MADGSITVEIVAEDGKFKSSVIKLGKETQSSLATAIKGSFIGNLFAQAFSQAAGVISSSIGNAVSRVDTLNQFPRVMQQIGFSAEAAHGSIDKMSEGIDGLPTSLDSIAGSAQNIALMTGDLESATDTALALNDAFIASGSSTADASRGMLQYTQMLSKGKVDAQAWYTLCETMGYALNEVAAQFGFTGESARNDLYAALQDGSISFEDFNNALIACDQAQGGFAETARTASAGIQTSWDNVITAIVKNLGNLINVFNSNGEISGALNGMKDSINQFGQGAVQAAQFIKDNWGIIAPIVAGVAGAFAGLQIGAVLAPAIASVTEAVKGFLALSKAIGGINTVLSVAKGAMAALGGPVTLVIAAIVALIAIFATLYATNQDFANAVNGAWAQIQAAFTAIQPSLQALGEQFMALGEAIMPALTQIGTLILDLATTLISALAPVIQQIVEAVTAAMPTITAAIQFVANVLAVIIGVVVQVVSAFVSFGQMLVSAAQSAADFVANVGSFLSGLPGVIWGFLTGALVNVANFVGQMASNAASAGSQFLGNIGGALGGLAGRVGGFLGSAIGQAASFVGQMASKASQAGQQFMNNIVSTLSGIPGRVASIGGQIVNGIANGIRGAAGAVVSALGGVVNQAVEHAKSMLGIHSPSRVFKNEVGRMIPRGAAEGIEADAAAMANAAGAMAARAVAAAEQATGTVSVPVGLDVSRASAAIGSVSASSILGESVMLRLDGIASRLDAIATLVSDIKEKMSGETSIKINQREFARLVREV